MSTAKQRGRAPRPVGERLAENIMIDDAGCWNWLLSKSPDGYGRMWIGGVGSGRMALAHRVSYETFVGVVPPGLQLDHLCRNAACINPEHLEPVTPLNNMRRRHGLPDWSGKRAKALLLHGRLR